LLLNEKSRKPVNFSLDLIDLMALLSMAKSVAAKSVIPQQTLERLKDRQFQPMVFMQAGSPSVLTSGPLQFRLAPTQHLKATVVDKLRHMHSINKVLISMTRTHRLNLVGIYVPLSNLMGLNHFLSR
jgi:hypothetical protein